MSDRPRIREMPEDFVVEEIPLYPASGAGEHTYLKIEKRLRTSDEVARLLARAADIRPRDVGYAGNKDRNAVTRQWYSVPGLDPRRAARLEFPGVRVLEVSRHKNKLRTGHLKGNRFELRVRGVAREQLAGIEARARELSDRGMPNRYGTQRFGRDGGNVEQGAALLRGDELAGSGDKRARRFLLSALQSAVFNDVLAERPGELGSVEIGDVATLSASGGMFLVEDLAREQPRADRFEISATGPIFGTRMLEAAGVVLERERAVFQRWNLPALSELVPPRGVRLHGARRALRVRLGGLQVRPGGDDDIRVFVTLPPGSYATVLLEELVGDFDDQSAPAVS